MALHQTGSSLGLTTILSTDSPWMRYLEALQDEWYEAAVLSVIGKDFMDDLLKRPDHDVLNDSTSHCSAKIIDLNRENNITIWRDLGEDELLADERASQAINHLVSGFRESGKDVSSRIVILQFGGDPNSRRWEYARFYLLFCHILGIELEVPPSDIYKLLGARNVRDTINGKLSWELKNVGRLSYLPQSSRIIRFDCGSHDLRPGIASCMLGPRRIAGSNIEHVVILLTDPWLRLDGYDYLLHVSAGLPDGEQLDRDSTLHCCFDGISEPPTPSKVFQNTHRPSPLAIEDAGALFLRCLNVGSWRTSAQSSGVVRWHWLSALIRMLLVQHELVRMQIMQLRGERLTRHHQSILWGTTSQIKEAVERFSRRLRALSEDHGLQSHDDVRSELRVLERQVEETLAIVCDVQRDAERLASKKSVEMSEITINESRNAVALTVLAFVFVPISLASSVFGMNVQEINGTGNGIWQFAVTAVVMLVMSAVSFAIWRMVKNFRVLSKYTKRTMADFEQASLKTKAEILKDSLRMAGGPIGDSGNQLSYALGLRRIEKAGVEAV